MALFSIVKVQQGGLVLVYQKQYYPEIRVIAGQIVHMQASVDRNYYKAMSNEEIRAMLEDLRTSRLLFERYSRKEYVESKPDRDRALAILSAMTSLVPDYAPYHYLMGEWYYLRLRNIEKAIPCFERAANCAEHPIQGQAVPLDARIQWWLGMCYTEDSPQNNHELALACFRQALALGWDDYEVFQGMRQISMQTMQKALRDNDSDLYFAMLELMIESLEGIVRTTDDETYRRKNQSDLEGVYYKIRQEREEEGDVAVFRKMRNIYAESLASKSEDPIEREKAIALAEELVREAPDDIGSIMSLVRVMLKVRPNLGGLRRLRELAQQNEDGLLSVVAVLSSAGETPGHVLAGETLGQTLIVLEQLRQDADIIAILSELETICTIASSNSTFAGLQVPLLMYVAECHNWMGNQRRWLDFWKKSLSLYEKAYELLDVSDSAQEEVRAHIREKMGPIHGIIGAHSRDIAHLRKAVTLVPYADFYWLALGAMQLEQHDGEAIYSLRRAAELGNVEARQLLRQIGR